MQNLRDKLLKAGLVSDQDAKRVEAEKAARRSPSSADPQRSSRPQRSGARPPERSNESAIPKLPPLPGSKAHQRLEAARQRELDAKLRQLVYENQVPVEPGEQTFYFVTRKGRLRRLELSPAQAKLLEEGALAVVERQEPDKIEHALVPPHIAEQMHAMFPKSVRFLNKREAPVGFLTDEELKAHQEREAARADEPDESNESEARGADGDARESEGDTPPGESADAQGAAERESETWISIKRAPV